MQYHIFRLQNFGNESIYALFRTAPRIFTFAPPHLFLPLPRPAKKCRPHIPGFKVDHQVAPLTLLQSWPPGRAARIIILLGIVQSASSANIELASVKSTKRLL